MKAYGERPVHYVVVGIVNLATRYIIMMCPSLTLASLRAPVLRCPSSC